ncbi:MAG: PQQ-binding-like beta-propeller repeat protein [Thermomicrobiales bacterium]
MDNADRHTLDELDAFLDRTFQGRAADSSALDPGLTECARRLSTRDDAPAADPIFLRNLREDLIITPTPALTGNAHAYPPSIVAPPRVAAPRPMPPAPKTTLRTLNHWRRRAWPAVEFLGAAMLLMGLLAGAFVTYNNGPAALNETAGSDVAMLGGNPARTGEMPGPGPEGRPGLVWKALVGVDHDLAPVSAPIVANDKVYLVASGLTGFADQFFLVAMDATTGQNLWQVRLDGTAYATPAVANGMLYVGITTHHVIRGSVVGTPDPLTTDLGYVVAFNAATGTEEWRQETRGSEASSPAIVDGSLFIGSTDGGMYAFDAETGDPLWQSGAAILNDAFWERNENEFAPLASSTPAAGDGVVVIASSLGTVHALDSDTGETLWSAPMPAGSLGMPVVSEDLILVAVDGVDPSPGGDVATPVGELGSASAESAAMLIALDTSSGAIRWTSYYWPTDHISPAAVSDDRIYTLEGNARASKVRALGTSDGEELWSHQLNSGPVEPPTVVNGVVYVGGGAGYVYAFDEVTGQEQWKVRIGGSVASPIWAVNDLLYLHSGTERSIYALGDFSAAAGTPGATPPVDEGVSGIPPCTVEPRTEPAIDLPGEGTPIAELFATPPVTSEASVVAVADHQRHGQPAAMRPEDVPDGPPASDSQVAEVTSTLEEMMLCHRPGNDGQVAAFYSDDFFRRPWVAVTVKGNGFQFLWAPEDQEALTFEETHVLDDGRVAVLIRYNEDFARLIVFTEQDGRWLIDETVQVGPLPEGRG